MPQKITITIDGTVFSGELNDSASGRKIASELPLTISMSRWGEEYYGSIGEALPMESGARDEMAVGELAYWPPGTAFCIFFGPTPASSGNEPRAASDCNPLGMLEGDVSGLKKLGHSISAKIEKA
jgi:uncharacterized protein